MAVAGGAEGLNPGVDAAGAVTGAGPRGLRLVGGGRRLADAVQVRPLFDLFVEVGVGEGGVGGAVPQLHARVASGVAGVHRPGQVAPLLGGPHDLSAGALTVPFGAVGGGKTRCRYAGERGRGGEHVGVLGGHHVGHHGSGGETADSDLRGVHVVALPDIGNHGHDADRVTAAATPERLGRGDVEALAAAGDLGEHDDVAVAVGGADEVPAEVVEDRACRPGAEVHQHQESRAGRHDVWHVPVHLHVAGVGSEVGHLGQAGGSRRACRQRHARRDQEPGHADEYRDQQAGSAFRTRSWCLGRVAAHMELLHVVVMWCGRAAAPPEGGGGARTGSTPAWRSISECVSGAQAPVSLP